MDYSKKLPDISDLNFDYTRKSVEESFEPCPSNGDTYVNDWIMTGWTGLINIDLVLSKAIEKKASDIHIAANQQIAFTILGDIVKQSEFAVPDRETMEDIMHGVLTNEAQALYVVEREYDTSYEIRFGYYKTRRFRVSIGKSFDADFLVFRTISDEIPSKESLNIEPEVESWFKNSSGAVLVCGPTGSGKALHKDTVVPSPNGTKKVKDVRIGDLLLDKDGETTQVVAIHKAESFDKFYKISFNNGEEILSTGRHDWYIYNNKGLLVKVDTTWMYNNQERLNLIIPRKFTAIEYLNNYHKDLRKTEFENLIYKQIDKICKFNNSEDCFRASILGSSLGYMIKKLNDKELYVDKNSKNRGFTIDSIEEIEDDFNDYFCFEVSGDSKTYMVGETFIPTHNSTTMASILRDIQIHQSKKIITIEKPIEAIYPSDGKSMIIQRSVPEDCLTFGNGLTGAMRQNPDYILIGEVRNHVEVSEFLRAAETGHLAMSTIHTVNNVTTLNRIRSLFQGEEQKRILATLGDVLRGIVNQALVKTKDGKSRFAVREILTIDYKIRKLIANDKFDEIRKYQEDNRLTMEHKLCEAFIEGKCYLDEARSKAPDQIYFDYLLKNVYLYE